VKFPLFIDKANQGFIEYSEFIGKRSIRWLAKRSLCPYAAMAAGGLGLGKEGQD